MDARTRNILDKEKNIVDEILSYVKNNKIVIDSSEYYDFVLLLKKLFSLDASIHDIKYSPDGKDNEVIFDVRALTTDETSGLCYNNIARDDNGRFVRDKAEIVINSNTHYFDELASEYPEYRISSAKKIIKTVYHELKHLVQLKSFVTNLSNERILKQAKEFVFLEGGYGGSHIYKKNHNSFMIENDADLNSYIRFDYVMDSNYDSRRKLGCLSKYYSSDIVVDRGSRQAVVSRDDLINQYIDFLIVSKKMKFLLMKYPILQKEYTFECKRKTFEELALKYMSELNIVILEPYMGKDKKSSLIQNIKEMYFYLFGRAIVKASKEEIQRVVSIVGIDTFSEMIEHNNKRALEEEKTLYLYYLGRDKKVSKYNYLRRSYNGEYIVYSDEGNYLCTVKEFKLLIDFESYDELEKEKIESFFIPHIPKCGCILTNDGDMIDPVEFFDKYFAPNMANIYDIDSFFEFLENNVQSENRLLFEVGRRRIRHAKNKKNYYYEEIIRNYDEEMRK